MIKVAEIKKALVSKLKEVRDIDVSFESMKKTDSNALDNKINEWYFVSLIPISTQLGGKEYRDRVVLVDVSYYDKKAFNNNYFAWNDEMSEAFLPYISIGDRNITIEESTFRIVDEVGHFVFSLKFRDSIDFKPEAQSVNASEEHEIHLNII